MVIVGKCSIPYNDLYSLSVSELNQIAEGRYENEREQWERTREIAYWSFLPHAKNPKKLKRKDLFSLPWDVEEKKKTMSESKKKSVTDHANRLVDMMNKGSITIVQKNISDLLKGENG